MNRITSKLFYVFFVFTVVWFDLKAAESVGCFFPFSECTLKKKQIVLNHYNIGTGLDSIITRILLVIQEIYCIQTKMEIMLS